MEFEALTGQKVMRSISLISQIIVKVSFKIIDMFHYLEAFNFWGVGVGEEVHLQNSLKTGPKIELKTFS